MNANTCLDADQFDFCCDHLILRDLVSLKAVGTYRLLEPSAARRAGKYYSEGVHGCANSAIAAQLSEKRGLGMRRTGLGSRLSLRRSVSPVVARPTGSAVRAPLHQER
jgi:hypothetical protein